ncbi:hypothetical protein JM93_03271 [Roseibium hamelinense]|uniref:Lipoprotein n=1 Tax=Roseibium hamelinense TaxID=150831 RepID=A0A562SN66_9HYPH|nr:lipoprotein [Roseibium hamelinense]MTI44035.1 hypothetical protein [Roseibium hamelinense]TWI82757.1 hypothetical protein JM93_03271 [Roseibium hamelinense]
MASKGMLKHSVLIGLAVALLLGGCGRRGSLEQPPQAGAVADPSASAGFSADFDGGDNTVGTGRGVEQPEPISERFPLDFLI